VDLVTLDFETFYDKDFSLRKMTTEAYVRDPLFEVIGVGVKLNNEPTEWASGTHNQIKKYLTQNFDWGETMLLCHNTMFDGAILNWCFDIRPRMYTDTLCIARALHGTEAGGSLAALSKRYNIGVKGTEVLDAKGKRRRDFTPEELSAYGDYCINDVELTYKLFNGMGRNFPREELRLIDLTLRMFTEPTLQLDEPLLHSHLADVKERKDKLLQDAQVSKTDLMSNPKFAELLTGLGIEPPMKTSPANGKETFAFSKQDEEFMALLDHENEAVQSLVAARLGTKSTLEETRTQRFIDIAQRGLLPVPVRYYAAHTGRWGGDDKINLQNLPSRGANGKKLKRSIIAPEGHTMIDCDSSQIEARVLAWLAGQDDLTAAFKNGDDVYKHMASSIYNVPVEDVTPQQRFVGKTTILGAGYGMGAIKFQAQLAGMGVTIKLKEARRIIKVYRDTNGAINQLWTDANNMIAYLARGDRTDFGSRRGLGISVNRTAIRLPSGLYMFYHALGKYATEDGEEYMYQTRKGMVRIYGGKVVENICQALARCIIGHQMILIAKKYKVALTVHDSIVVAVRDTELDEARTYVEHCMGQKPNWAAGLPITCESSVGKSYGDCE